MKFAEITSLTGVEAPHGVQVGSVGVQVGFAGRLRKLPWLRS
jgi:hypothetical protein